MTNMQNDKLVLYLLSALSLFVYKSISINRKAIFSKDQRYHIE